MNAVLFLMQISCLRFKQSRISLLNSHIYVLGCFVNFLVIFRYIWREIVCKITRRCMDKKKFSTFSYKLVQISPIMILRAHRTNFCHDTIHFFFWSPPKNAKHYGYVQVANYAKRDSGL